MPEFILDHGTREAADVFKSLDSFTQGYIEAMFFTECDSDDEELSDATMADLAPEALNEIKETCADFQASFAVDMAEACDNGRINGYDMHRAGVDFWFTRNDHGAGFWDRGLGAVGDRLTRMAKSYGPCDPYRGDDGKIYVA